MQKLLFFDYRELEAIDGFDRVLGHPEKVGRAPLFVADQPWENGNMQLYGSVLERPGGGFQAWYSLIHAPWRMYLGYAESDDGLEWRKPVFDIFTHQGQPTNILLDVHIHGPAVIYDAREPDASRRYKLIGGAEPSNCITAFTSADGIHWQRACRHPAIPTDPDCPMGFCRARDGRYVVFHRVNGFGRRVFRSESWDFTYWSGEPRMVLEPDAGDDCQTQFYGFGACPYGSYQIGTLWAYHTDLADDGQHKLCGSQEAELTYARSGYAIHRAAPGQAFLPRGAPEDWDRGNLQCASQPVFLPHEIRYYYAGTDMRHQQHWELEPQTAGLGLAYLRPDGFVRLEAGEAVAELTTMPFQPRATQFFVNAKTKPDGWVKAEMLDAHGQPLPGRSEADCAPVTGDSTAHPLRWNDDPVSGVNLDCPIRLRIRAQNAALYSLFIAEPDKARDYPNFEALLP